MKNNKKKYYKFICICCDAGSAISLIISLIFTTLFFASGTHKEEMILMIFISVMFEMVKILLVITENKKIVAKCLMLIFIMISIMFTMNSFLNKIDNEKLESKQINPEFTKQNSKIENKKKEIENKKKEIEENKKLKIEAVNGISELLASKRIETAKLYQEDVDEKENELKDLQNELNKLVDHNIEEFVFTDNTSNINTKVLDFIFKDKLDQKTKNLLISIFIALLIDFTHITLTFVKKNAKLEIAKIEKVEEEENKIKKAEEVEKIKEAKKKEIINTAAAEETFVGHEEKGNLITLKKASDKENQLSNIANKILDMTLNNNGVVPAYRELSDILKVSVSVVQRRIKELKDKGIIYKVENKKELRLIKNIENLNTEIN